MNHYTLNRLLSNEQQQALDVLLDTLDMAVYSDTYIAPLDEEEAEPAPAPLVDNTNTHDKLPALTR